MRLKGLAGGLILAPQCISDFVPEHTFWPFDHLLPFEPLCEHAVALQWMTDHPKQ